MTPVLEAKGLAVSFGGVKAVDDVSFAAEAGKVLSIIGPNGAGKTTVFNLVSGLYAPAKGRVLLGGADVTGLPPHRLAAAGLSRTFQNLQIFLRMTAIENVMVGRHLHESRNVLAHLVGLPGVARREVETRAAALRLLDSVGLAADADRPAGSLPYGALKRLEIARALAGEPRALLLDEPAAGCNAVETTEIDALIRAVAARGVAVVLVEHDMRLVMKISDRILVLNAGRRLTEGGVAEVRSHPAVLKAYLGERGLEEVALARG